MSGGFSDNRKNNVKTSRQWQPFVPLPLRNRPRIHPQHFCQLSVAQPMLKFVPFDLAAKGGRFVIERIVAEKCDDSGILV
ncbi:MAG: hypothetical protein JWQ30_1849 [Sediminibacterium sp.]|nr:hypothetical protein [Sediminibacterium sp.]